MFLLIGLFVIFVYNTIWSAGYSRGMADAEDYFRQADNLVQIHERLRLLRASLQINADDVCAIAAIRDSMPITSLEGQRLTFHLQWLTGGYEVYVQLIRAELQKAKETGFSNPDPSYLADPPDTIICK